MKTTPVEIRQILDNITTDKLSVGNRIVFSAINYDSDKTITSSFTVLAVTGLIVALSQEDYHDDFYRWLTIPQLRQLTKNKIDSILTNYDAIKVEIDLTGISEFEL